MYTRVYWNQNFKFVVLGLTSNASIYSKMTELCAKINGITCNKFEFRQKVLQNLELYTQ